MPPIWNLLASYRTTYTNHFLLTCSKEFSHKHYLNIWLITHLDNTSVYLYPLELGPTNVNGSRSNADLSGDNIFTVSVHIWYESIICLSKSFICFIFVPVYKETIVINIGSYLESFLLQATNTLAHPLGSRWHKTRNIGTLLLFYKSRMSLYAEIPCIGYWNQCHLKQWTRVGLKRSNIYLRHISEIHVSIFFKIKYILRVKSKTRILYIWNEIEEWNQF